MENLESGKSARHFLDKLKMLNKHSVEEQELARKDIAGGLSEEQVLEYLNSGWSIEKMKMYSEFLRLGMSDEVKALLKIENLSAEQMEVVWAYYQKGIDVEVIQKVAGTKQTAYTMTLALEECQRELESAKEEVKEEDDAFEAKEMMRLIEEKMSGFVTQTQYESLFKRMEAVIDSAQDKEEYVKLQRENGSLGAQLQQVKEKENQSQQEILTLHQTIQKYEEQIEQSKYEKEPIEEVEVEMLEVKKEEEHPVNEQLSYQVPVFKNGGAVATVLVETEKRNPRKGFMGFLERFTLKKKSRRDIVRKVIDKKLNTAQLEQVRIGIESGLTEHQLDQLINSGLTPEQMEEIIMIAVIESEYEGQEW